MYETKTCTTPSVRINAKIAKEDHILHCALAPAEAYLCWHKTVTTYCSKSMRIAPKKISSHGAKSQRFSGNEYLHLWRRSSSCKQRWCLESATASQQKCNISVARYMRQKILILGTSFCNFEHQEYTTISALCMANHPRIVVLLILVL